MEASVTVDHNVSSVLWELGELSSGDEGPGSNLEATTVVEIDYWGETKLHSDEVQGGVAGQSLFGRVHSATGCNFCGYKFTGFVCPYERD